MDFHRGLADPDIACDLLVETPLCDVKHDLALPGCQRLEPLFQRSQRIFVFTTYTVARKTALNRVEQVLILERFRKEIDRASFHRLHGHGNIAVPGDEDDGNLSICRNQLALEIETASPRHVHIEHQTACATRMLGL